MSSAAPNHYETAHKKRLAEAPTYRVTEFHATPGQQSPWHYHSVITDLFYVLDGHLQLSLDGPAQTVELKAGQCHQIEPGRVHRFQAMGQGLTRYLLIQQGASFDFITVEVEG